MADIISPEQRSRVMSRIRLRDTVPELALRRALWAAGMRYRLVLNTPLLGKPDIVFPGPRVVIFVDGCFWHGCPIHGHVPKSQESYWAPKLARNIQRDADVTARLGEQGWQVLRFWEHQVRKELAICVSKVASVVKQGKTPSRQPSP